MKITVHALRQLAAEITAILDESDARCSTVFALSLDDTRERLQPALEASLKNQERIQRQHADRDAKNNPKRDDKGILKYSTAEQEIAVSDAILELLHAEIEMPDNLTKITKRQLVANGISASGTRITRLRPILDVALDEPQSIDDGERRIVVAAKPGIPSA